MGKRLSLSLLLFLSAFLLPLCVEGTFNDYRIGTGIYDVTGPAAEEGMMGYAMINQKTKGLHIRQRARAFIFDNNQSGSANRRVVFVSSDICMMYDEVKQAVVKKLQADYGNVYQMENVMLSGTHTHSGPGGFTWYALYDVTTLGFNKANFDVIVEGIYNAIKRAHQSLSQGGRILINDGELDSSNINRSPAAYENNPSAEKSKFSFNTDHLMTLLRLQDQNGKDIGMLNWFAVHGTSMNNTNGLISGDNKGYASLLFEKTMNGNALPGTGPYVAAFAQSNEGDVSPNTRGAFCPDGVTPCDHVHSTCNGKNEGCHGYGPGSTDFESTEIIGTNQFKMASKLFQSATSQVRGSEISYVHMYVAMENVTVGPQWSPTGKEEKTCMAGLGDSFAAGTTDGPGEFDFRQGSNSTKDNPFWNFIAGFLSKPTAQEKKCHYPKPILLNVGGISFPLPWVPHQIPLQIFKIGDLFIVGVPGEFTTMSGRRLRETIRSTLIQLGVANNQTTVVIAGLSNAYTHYITTYEEYAIQRYEGASTLYGPFTLSAYQQLYSGLVTSLVKGTPVPPGPTPPDLSGKTFNFQPGVVVDGHPIGKPFGSIHTDALPQYIAGETVTVQFWGAHPKNNFMTEGTFLTVERDKGNGQWDVEFVDGDWETKYHWKRDGVDRSIITIEWEIPRGVGEGRFRIQHFGYSRDLLGKISPYQGASSPFSVVASK